MFFNRKKIRGLEEELRECELESRKYKKISALLHEKLEEYEELLDLKDQRVVITQDGKFSQLMIGGKLIRNVTSVEVERYGSGVLNEFKFGILADDIIIRKKESKTCTQTTKQISTANGQESITRIKRIDVTTLAD